MTNPTISVCIPTHLRFDMLEGALESVLGQSHPPCEVVVSDDAADPATARVVASFASRASFPIRSVNCQNCGSQAENVNSSLEAASSDLLVLLHDDDLLYPKALELLVRPFLEVPGLVASYGLQMRVTNSGQEMESESSNRDFFRIEKEAGLKTESLRSAVLGQFPNDGFMIRSSVAKAVLYEPDYGAACDTVFGVRSASHGPFYFVPVWISKYRLSTHSVGRGKGRKRDEAGYHFVRLCLELLQKGAPCKPELELRLRERISVAIVQAAALGDTERALSWLLGPYHRGQLLSFPGAKRTLLVALACLRARQPLWRHRVRKELQSELKKRAPSR